MLRTSFDANKFRSNIRMAVVRLNMQKNKLVNSVKMQRRGIAELLAIGKYDAARIRVENCIREDVSIEGLEVLSLFLDLLGARTRLIAENKPVRTAAGHKDISSGCPPELKEAISSILWAGSRIGDTVPEVAMLRKAFEVKYGTGFVEMCINNSEYSVNQKMLERLNLYTPPNEKCIAYLTGIATEFALENYDEERLRDSNGIMASTILADGSMAAECPGEEPCNKISGFICTPSGLQIPSLSVPYDAIDRRLLALKRA